MPRARPVVLHGGSYQQDREYFQMPRACRAVSRLSLLSSEREPS
jgi:hypothetical protein